MKHAGRHIINDLRDTLHSEVRITGERINGKVVKKKVARGSLAYRQTRYALLRRVPRAVTWARKGYMEC